MRQINLSTYHKTPTFIHNTSDMTSGASTVDRPMQGSNGRTPSSATKDRQRRGRKITKRDK
jgi:hypothetical protein